MAAYIASSAGPDTGAEFTLADGASATLNLLGAGDVVPAGASATIHIKTSAGGYVKVGDLDAGSPCAQVFGPATFLVRKNANAVAFGVDKS